MRHKLHIAAVLLALALLCLACPPHPPQEKVWVDVCNDTLLLVTPWCPGHHMAQYIKGQEPTTPCTLHGPLEVEVCKESGLLPTGCCRDKEVRPFFPGDEPVEKCGVHLKVGVTVCKTTGLLPNAACPEREIRMYCPDEKPAAICVQHQKKPIPAGDRALIVYGLLGTLGDDARWLTFDGTAWKFDRAALQAHLMAISDAGANTVRLFAYTGAEFTPFVKPGNAWDIGAFNDYYFPVMRQAIQAANECGLRVIFDWLNNCETGQASPYFNNSNGVDGYYDQAAYPHVRSFMKRCVDEFAGLDIIWSFGNEMSGDGAIELAQNTFFPVVREKNLDPAKLTVGAQMTRVPYNPATGAYSGPPTVQDIIRANFENYGNPPNGEPAKLKLGREVHNCGVAVGPDTMVDQALWWWGGNPQVGWFIISDDGEWGGASACDRTFYNGQWQVRPSPGQWRTTAREVFTRSTRGGVEHAPKAAHDVVCQQMTFRAISDEYKNAHGEMPGNYRA